MKRKRNPVDDLLMYRMIGIIVGGSALQNGFPIKKELSYLLSLKASDIDYVCGDCKEYFEDCTCEGDTEIQGKCKYCKQNYCICDYDLNNENNIIKEIANLAKRWFNDKQMERFIKIINLETKEPYSKKVKQHLQALINLLQRKSNPKNQKNPRKKKK